MATSLADYYVRGPKTTAEAFPPACLRTHWDPTMVSKHVLPESALAPQVLDPRPAAKICTAYHHTSAGDAPAPPVPGPSVGLPPTPAQFLGGDHRPTAGPAAWPPGGTARRGFPYDGYKASVESDLFRENEPLTKCSEKRYIPVGGVPAPAVGTNLVPGAEQPALPELYLSRAGCREADDAEAWARSSRLFFNVTRYDRTNTTPPNLRKPESQQVARMPY